MDLVEGGDVRRLFSDAELLELVGAEEEQARRTVADAHNQSGVRSASRIPRELTQATRGGGNGFSAEEAPALGEAGGPGSPTANRDEVW